MAKSSQARSPVSAMVPNKDAQNTIIAYASRILEEHKKFQDYRNKMELIDIAYARYQANKNSQGVVSGQGIDAATTPVGVINLPSTVPPVLVSQVDSMVGYLADVFLSGSPLFPIVSSPSTMIEAETLESLIDDHATLGGYARQLLMFLRDCTKYNAGAIEADWASISQYSISEEFLDTDQNKINKNALYFTKLRRLDMYNTIWDMNVQPGDVALEGDYAGYISILSRTKMKRLLTRLSVEGEVINAKEAMDAKYTSGAETFPNYYIHPQISDYIATRRPVDGVNYYEYITGMKEKLTAGLLNVNNFELLTLYARILPAEFRLYGTESRTPQIWKFQIVNGSVVIQAKRIISAYDTLPIFFGQPLEDGLGYQTQSIAEGSIPFQTAAATLFNIRFNAARRAVSDRALYDPSLISKADIQAPVPAAKIPVQSNSLDQGKKISDAYHPIPFDPRGTETAIQDGMTLVGFGKELNGLNNPMRGQFQKGNKSVREWEDTMSGADARLRLPALALECQTFTPLKETLKLNIYQYGADAVTVSQRSGKEFNAQIAKLREKVLTFRVADGYTPKSKLASTDTLMQGMQMISQSGPLQQSFGAMLPSMFTHLMRLAGVRGIEEYTPTQEQATANMNMAAARGATPMNPAEVAAAQAEANKNNATATNQTAQAAAALAGASQPTGPTGAK